MHGMIALASDDASTEILGQRSAEDALSRVYALQQAGRWRKAVDAWCALREFGPQDVALQTEVELAVGSLWSGRSTRRAQKAFDRALSLDPSKAECYCARAYFFANKGDLKAARSDFERCIVGDPSHVEGLIGRALLAYAEEGWEAAIVDLGRALRLAPFRGDAYFARGQCHWRIGALDAALSDLDAAILLNPDDAGAFNSRGCVWTERGDAERALDDFEDALRLAPHAYDTHINYAIALSQEGRERNALAAFGRAGGIEPHGVRMLLARGEMHMCAERYSEAEKDFSEALANDKNCVAALVQRGMCRSLRGDWSVARTDFMGAVQRGYETGVFHLASIASDCLLDVQTMGDA